MDYRVQEVADERRLWDHILTHAFGTSDLSILKNLPPDPQGYAFFCAVDSAFASYCGSKSEVRINHVLVWYMAGWCRDTARGYVQQGGGLEGGHNHFVRRAYGAFIQTLREAIKAGRLRYGKDRTLFGCFPVPQWLIDKYMDELREEADHFNKQWDKNPDSMRDFLKWQINESFR